MCTALPITSEGRFSPLGALGMGLVSHGSMRGESNMKTLSVQGRLEFAHAGAAVLRALALLKTTMRYADFATAIGLKQEGEKWAPWHRQQVADILNLIAATERDAGKKTGAAPLQYGLVVTGSGSPGAGVHSVSKIVTSRPSK
jgi:hypothetical protein